jgi:hypothetical protein
MRTITKSSGGCRLLALLVLSISSSQLYAWGHDGHTTVGLLAIERLDEGSRNQLQEIMGSLDQEIMSEACNWPDEIRETDEWSWTYPLHYINIPRGDFKYQKFRDCPNGKCATEAIKTYAAELGDATNSVEKRQQAFAWVCHLTGDLHQPLHAGFADDRGGNDFEVVYRGENTNLHSVWDSKIVGQHTTSIQDLKLQVATAPRLILKEGVSADLINDWTNESHELAKTQIYPTSAKISHDYEARSWVMIRKRINIAASRLAVIINSELK